MKVFTIRNFIFLVALQLSVGANAQKSEPKAEATSDVGIETLDQRSEELAPVALSVEELKKKVIELNRDLFILEEDLLFPSSTQVVVYVSMDVGTYFDLDAVELKIDDKVVSHHLYTEKQIQALFKGGVQKLHIDNLAQGEHQLSAFFIGKGPQNRDYKRATSFTFTKTAEAKSLELSIIDSSVKQQPIFKAVEL